MNKQIFRLSVLLLLLAFRLPAEPVYELSGTTLLNYSWKNTGRIFAIPEGVTAIAPECFAEQWKNPVLEKIFLPSSLQILPEGFWQGCLESLVTLEAAAGHPSFMTIDGVLFTRDGRTLICYPPGKPDEIYVLPENVEVLGPWCFRDSRHLKAVRLPAGLRIIGEGAFYDCRSLSRLVIPAEISEIGRDAFRRCQNPGSVYEILYCSAASADLPALAYGLPEDAAGTAVCLPGTPLPESHFGTQILTGYPYDIRLLPGWNLFYLPADHPLFFQKNILSCLRAFYNPSKRCYITISGVPVKNALYWLFCQSRKPVFCQGRSLEPLQIPEHENPLPGWKVQTYSQFMKQPAAVQNFRFWNAESQRYETGAAGRGPDPDTPVWIPADNHGKEGQSSQISN